MLHVTQRLWRRQSPSHSGLAYQYLQEWASCNNLYQNIDTYYSWIMHVSTGKWLSPVERRSQSGLLGTKCALKEMLMSPTVQQIAGRRRSSSNIFFVMFIRKPPWSAGTWYGKLASTWCTSKPDLVLPWIINTSQVQSEKSFSAWFLLDAPPINEPVGHCSGGRASTCKFKKTSWVTCGFYRWIV